MRAWTIGAEPGPAGLTLVERPDPSIGPEDVLIRARAVALNYRDLVVTSGGYTRGQQPIGAVPCSDVAGDVVEIGRSVRTVRVGDRVTSSFSPGWLSGPLTRAALKTSLGSGDTPGVLADLVALPAVSVVPVPGHLSFEEASTLPCAGLTAWHAVREATAVDPRSSVLTLGSGGVSAFAIQFASRAGARVIATTSTEAKRQQLQALGAAVTINRRETPAWGEAARLLSGGEGVDVVVDVAGQGALAESCRAVRPGGTICLIGTLAASTSTPVNLAPIFLRNIRLQGVTVGSREMFLRMNAHLAEATIRPVIDSVWPFEEAVAAFERLRSGGHVGKVVIAKEVT
jgi:NADPH:quinone reductase-like Zn-dependent oxidoreductase